MLNLKRNRVKMVELVRMMRTLDQQVAKCSRCGICQSVCPLYGITKNESDVARGKLMLLDGLMRSFFADPDEVRQRLDRCLLCGACAVNCPRGVNVVEIFLNARMIMAGYRRMPLVKKIIFRYVLSNPQFFDRIISWGAKWQYLVFKKTDFQIDASCAAIVSPLLSKRHMVSLAPVPFHKMNLKQKNADLKTGVKVAFFVGCLLDKVFPKVAEDIVRVLNYHGVRVIIPPSQGCCGIPALASGDHLTFNRLVAYNLQLFDLSDFDYLVTGCATCTATIKKTWPSLFVSSSPEKNAALRQLAEKTYDISQFLVDVIGVRSPAKATPQASKSVATYHDPCHLRKSLDVYTEPRHLIQANDAYTFMEMPDADSCCGMGGSFNLAYYDLSVAIGKKKIINIKKTGATVVATGCPACMIQLANMLSREKKHVRVAHVVELYSETILPAKGGETV